MNCVDPFYLEMDQLIEEQIQKVCTSLFCQLCDVKITSLSVERSHYSCKRHLEEVALYRSELLREWSTKKAQISLYSVKATNAGITASKKSLQAVGSDQYEIPKRINSPGPSVANQCSVCNTSFSAEHDFKEHMQMYPHQQLAKLKSDLVKKGILNEYWTVDANGYVICCICNAQLQTSNSMQLHMNTNRHNQMFQFWCSLFTADKTDEQFYCKTCNTKLHGASEAKKHYSTDVHIRHAQNISATSSIQQKHEVKVSSANHDPPTPTLPPERTDKHHEDNSMTNPKKPSFCSPELGANQVKDTATNNSIVCNTKSPDTKTEECREPLSLSKLKQEVFNELDRLVQKLYYSNTVPYIVSLEYLKRINREVDELAKKNDDKRHKASKERVVIKPEPKTDYQEIYSCDFIKEETNNNIDEMLGKDQYIDTVNVNSLRKMLMNPKVRDISPKKTSLSMGSEWDELDLPNNEVYADDSGKLILPKICPILTNNANQTNFEASTSKPETFLIVKRSSVNDVLPKIVQKKAASISELLDKIQQKKHDMLTDKSEEGRLERELLSEIEFLMLQIENSNIPLEETLKCLEKFNKELDKQVSSEQLNGKSDGRLPDDEKSDTELASKGKVGNEHTNAPDMKIAQNSEGTSQAKINQGGHEVFYADESARSNEGKVEPEENILKESKLEETRSVQQDLPVESSELYEKRLSLDFYSYYSGTNFYKFADFRNVYLNGSMEELENWNALRNNKRLLQEK
ncbi:uncharacterized protein LOC109533950 isoform X1 [Dendroctonus ponderosae]|uniref:uncharacterized protein LOC109533950 isoform X1 n=2 Tax=Dendroctonus ponderosae TaxID=77166 RepID=UPI002035399C|nr:uncharacterized protein LOC109533950 isoform X1 [Dendroctonus ponderosae]KAH1015195.1 hypothetical protein HUJ05_012963 [Dendroctonus ponderosae]